MAVLIHGPAEGLPPALDTYRGFVDIPAVSNLAVSSFAPGLAEERSQLASPLPHGSMGKHEAPLEEHLGRIPQAELGPEAPQHHQADDVDRILPPIEGGAGPFLTLPLTVTTAEAAIPQLCPIRALDGRRPLTMRARHGLALRSEVRVSTRCHKNLA
jgi:hypothetical protein